MRSHVPRREPWEGDGESVRTLQVFGLAWLGGSTLGNRSCRFRKFTGLERGSATQPTSRPAVFSRKQKATKPRAAGAPRPKSAAAIFNQLLMCSTDANCCCLVASSGEKLPVNVLLPFAASARFGRRPPHPEKWRTKFAFWDHPGVWCFSSDQKKKEKDFSSL